MIKSKYIFFFLSLLFCFCHSGVFAQNQTNKRIDSLLTVLKTAREDTGKAKSLNALSEQLWRINNYNDSRKYADSAFILSERLDFKKGMGSAYLNIGVIYFHQGNYSEAMKNQLASLKIWKETGDRRGIAGSYNNIGNIFERQGNYPEALKNQQASLKFMEEAGDKGGIASSYNNIGNILLKQGNYSGALKNYLASLKICEGIGDKRGIAASYINMGNIYYYQENETEALKNYLEALKYFEIIGDLRGSAFCYSNIGSIYQNQLNYKEALKNYLASLKIREAIGDKAGVAHSSIGIGFSYESQDNYPEAIKNYLIALRIFEEIENKNGIAISCNYMGSVLSKQAAQEKYAVAKQKYAKSLQYLNRGLLLAKEIGAKESVKDAYEGLADTYKKMKDYERAFEYLNLYTELKDSLMNDETADKLEQQRIQYEVEKSVEEEKLKNQAALAESKAIQKRKTDLMMMGAGMLIVILILFFLFWRQKSLKQKAVDKAEAKHKMAELELQSLRSQLNPHFMFNSLNAIQDLILKEDNDRAHLYLSRFSKLMRILLDNASQPFVSVKQEIDFLELYLSLENLRISELKISIEKDPGLNTEKRMIPSMMLQPYIENAIWHGLSNKKGERRLQIRIHENGSATEFEIEDNGIGRKKAAELKKLYRQGHHSKGMELLSKRFNLLSKEYGATIQTTITDLGNNGDATGTLVKIDVPFTLSDQANQLVHDTNHNN